jgi:O-antigen/teichoic acid export membrane protein
MRRFSRDLLIVGLLFLLPLLLFWSQTIGGRTLLPGDNLFQYLPHAAARDSLGVPAVPHNALLSDLVLQNMQWKSFIRDSIAQGEIPLWNPHQFSGIPFFAAGQQSTLYPLSILYYALPLSAAYGWFTVAQLWLAGVFMYAFLRGIGVGRAGGAVGAITYQLAGFFVASAVFPMIIGAAAWLPLLLLLIEWLIQQRPLFGRPASVPWLIAGAVALGCSIFAGHVEITYYTLLIMAYYAAARLAWLLWRERSPRQVIGRGVWLAAMVTLGVGLGAVQFVPLFEFAGMNYRSNRSSYDQVIGWAHPLRDLILFAVPNFYGSPAHHGYFDVFSRTYVDLTAIETLSLRGQPLTTIDWGIKNYVEGALYVGVLPLALAAYALVARRPPSNAAKQPPYRWILLALAVLALSFMFGLPTYRLLYLLPGIDQLHSPFRWVYALTFCLAALAALGLDRLLAAHPSATTRRFIGWLLVAIGAQVLAALAISYALFPQIEPFLSRLLAGIAEADRAFSDAPMFYSYQFPHFLVLGVVALGAGVVFLRPNAVLAAGVVALDLLIATWNFNPASDPAWLDFTPPAITWLQQQPGNQPGDQPGAWRYTTLDDPTQPPLMNANVGWRYGLDDVRGYESIISRAYVDYMQGLAPQVQLSFNRVAPLYTVYPEGIAFDYRTALASARLDELNVRYVMTHLTTDISAVPGYALVYEDAAVRIWENADALPRAYFAHEGEVIPAVIESDSGRELLIRIPANPPNATLNVSISGYPGWRAFIRPAGGMEDDEAVVEVFSAPLLSVTIPPSDGEQIVRLVYSPASFQIGLFASFIAGALLALAGGAWLWRAFVARTDDDGSTAGRVARNSIAPILLNLFNRGIDFAFALVMLRVLGPEGSGVYTYVVVIFGWFDIVTNFGLNLYLIRETARDRLRAAAILLNTSVLRLALVGVCVPLALAFVALRQSSISPPLSAEALTALGLLYISLIPGTINTGLAALFYGWEQIEIPSATATLVTIFGAAARLIALLLGYGVIGLAAVSIAANLLTLAILAWHARRLLADGWRDLRVRLSAMRRMLGESWSLMLNHLLATIFFQIDVIIIEAFHGERMVGQYGVAYKWLLALNIIPSFFTQAMLPVMSRQFHADKAALERGYAFSVKLLLTLALPVAVAFTFLAEFLTGVLGGAAFLPDGAIATQIMIWSIPVGWMNSLTQYALIAVDRQRQITGAFALAVGFNIVTNLLFVPGYGYQAAAITTILSEGVLFVTFIRLMASSGIRPNWLNVIARPALAGALMFGATALGWALHPLIGLALGGAVYTGAVLALRVFTPEELKRAAGLLPGRVQQVTQRWLPA